MSEEATGVDKQIIGASTAAQAGNLVVASTIIEMESVFQTMHSAEETVKSLGHTSHEIAVLP